ncbi:hypothetical protein [Pleurochrysis sp. endemic virus 1b]|nr:hypothetical protein [Pleurochrysis sp. endemic virus 1b]
MQQLPMTVLDTPMLMLGCVSLVIVVREIYLSVKTASLANDKHEQSILKLKNLF